MGNSRKSTPDTWPIDGLCLRAVTAVVVHHSAVAIAAKDDFYPLWKPCQAYEAAVETNVGHGRGEHVPVNSVEGPVHPYPRQRKPFGKKMIRKGIINIWMLSLRRVPFIQSILPR